MSRRWLLLVPALAAAVAVAACTPHPVGPARTDDSYTGKAVTTAESALSAVETVRLAAGADAFGAYLSVTISDQEEALGGVQGTFASIQPPSTTADELRAELDELLSSALGHVVDVRVAARRGERLEGVASPLADDADALRAFIEEHGG